VHVVEAAKQVYRAIPARRERTRLIPALEPVLAPSIRWPLAVLRSSVIRSAATLHVVPRTAVTPSPSMERESVGPSIVAILALLMWLSLLLTARDEWGQPLHIPFAGTALSRAWRKLLLAVLIGLAIPGHIGLWFTGAVRNLCRSKGGILLALIQRPLSGPIFALCARELRIVLPELLLRGGNYPIVVLGMLIVILGSDGIPWGLRIAGELNVFFGYVRWIATNFDVWPVGLIDACHRIVTLAMIVASTHPLVLTVSHDWPAADSFASGLSRPLFAQSPNTILRDPRQTDAPR
jgi:hypothetical protein